MERLRHWSGLPRENTLLTQATSMTEGVRAPPREDPLRGPSISALYAVFDWFPDRAVQSPRPRVLRSSHPTCRSRFVRYPPPGSGNDEGTFALSAARQPPSVRVRPAGAAGRTKLSPGACTRQRNGTWGRWTKASPAGRFSPEASHIADSLRRTGRTLPSFQPRPPYPRWTGHG